jgi:hypothetical protein
MNNFVIQKIKSLMINTMNGDLSLDGFYSQWDDTWSENMYIKEIYANIVTSIEHIPGQFFSTAINKNKWLNSFEYAILEIDLQLLDYCNELSELQLLKKRNDLIKKI